MKLAQVYEVRVRQDIDLSLLQLIAEALSKLNLRGNVIPQKNDLVVFTEKGPLTIDIMDRGNFYKAIIGGEMEEKERNAMGVYVILLIQEEELGEKPRKVIEGKKLSLMSRGVPVLEVSPGEVPNILTEIINRFRKEKTYIKSVKPSKAKTLLDIQIGMLMAIPGVGEERARKLLTKFGSIKNIANAPLKDLEKAVGVKTAKLIYATLRTRAEKSEQMMLS